MNENRLRLSLSLIGLAMVVGAGCAASPPDDAAITEGAMTSADPLPTRDGCPGTWEHVHQYGGLAGGQFTAIGDKPLILSATFSDITNEGGPRFQGQFEATFVQSAYTGEDFTIRGGFVAFAENSSVLPLLDFYNGPLAHSVSMTRPVVYGVREGANNTISELCLVAARPYGGFILKR